MWSRTRFGNEHSVLDPVFYRHLSDWTARATSYTPEEIAKLDATDGWHTAEICGWAQDFQDYKVWFMLQSIKEIGWDGFYYDNQSFRACENPAHRDHQFVDDQGKRVMVTPIRQYRQLFKRIYRELKKANRTH